MTAESVRTSTLRPGSSSATEALLLRAGILDWSCSLNWSMGWVFCVEFFGGRD